MNILVYGSGAVGRYLAAHLSKTGQHVVLISRSNTPQLNEAGITVLKDQGSTVRVQPLAVPSLRQALIKADEIDKPFDYILITTKSYDIPDVINQIAAYIPNPPPIITMQNGIDIELALTNQFGADKIIAGSLTIPVSYNHNLDIVEERSDRGVCFASVEKSKNHLPVVKMFKQSGLTVESIADYESLKWSKALTNMIGNATSAIINRHPGVLYKYKPIFQLEMRMLNEALAVMKAKKIKVIDLPGTSVKRLVFGMRWLPQNWLHSILTRQVAKGRGDKMPSFQIDLAAGKQKNEVLYHNGAVNRIGREMGIPTYINAALTDTLLGIAYGEIDWQLYSGKPKAFITAVNHHIRDQKKKETAE